METVINLGEIKEANAPEVKIDELATKAKSISSLEDEDVGARACVIAFMDGETNKGSMEVDAYVHGNTPVCVKQMRELLVSIVKNSAKSPNAAASLLLESALDLLCEAGKAEDTPVIRDAVAGVAKAYFKYL